MTSARLDAEASMQKLASPDGSVAAEIRVDDRIHYDVIVADSPVLKNAAMSLEIDGITLGAAPKLKSVTPRSYDGVLHPVVRQKAAEFREHYNELRFEFEGGCSIVFRAYNEGFAYRWETSLPAAQVKVDREEVALNFADNFTAFYPEEESFHSHNERIFLPRALRDLASQNLASIPAVVDANGIKIAVAESAYRDECDEADA